MKTIKNIIYFLSLIFLLICLVYSVCYFIPFNKICKSNEINIYGKDGTFLISSHYENEGKYLKIDEINEDFIYCFIASEDSNFYNHMGFSIKGIIRALYLNLTTDSTQGGSTISQQLSRLLFLNNEKTIVRKIKEALITICIETHYEKDFIIEQYLNSIYLGHNIYGIEQASQYYFSKTNKDLTLDEVAMIVGIANAPNINAPDVNYNNALNRKNYVLSQLYEIEYIDKKQLKDYCDKQTIINIKKTYYDNHNLYILNYVINELKNKKLYTKENLAKGFNVYTTIDNNIQKIAYETTSKFNPCDNSQIAIVIMKPNSNEVLAMINSYDLNDQYNRAINSLRPIGSTIKPLLYYLALKNGFTPTTFLSVNKQQFNIKGYGNYSPSNAYEKYSNKPINMIEAIGLSDNIYATKTLLYLGINTFSDFLLKFNIESKKVPSIALGVDETSLINLVSIYNCFASIGNYYEPKIICKITNGFNEMLYHNDSGYIRKLQRPYVFVLNQLLKAPFDEKLIDYSRPTLINYKTKYAYAAKTGSDDHNAYTIGFNPSYTIGIWTGTDNNETFTNKNISKKVFVEISNLITNKNLWYDPPGYIIKKTIDPITGIDKKNGSTYWFIKDY